MDRMRHLAEIQRMGVLALAAIRREHRGAPPPDVPAGLDLRPIEGFPGYAIGRDKTVWTSWKMGGLRGPWRRLARVMRGRNKTSRTVILTDAGGNRRFRPVERLYRETFLNPRLPDGDPGLEEIEDVDDLAEDARLGMPVVPPLPFRRPCPTPSDPPPIPIRHPSPPSRPEPLPVGPPAERPSFGPHARGSDSPTAKLDEAKVIELRQLFESMGALALARRYGISEASVYNAAIGKTWKHVPGAIVRSLTPRDARH